MSRWMKFVMVLVVIGLLSGCTTLLKEEDQGQEDNKSEVTEDMEDATDGVTDKEETVITDETFEEVVVSEVMDEEVVTEMDSLITTDDLTTVYAYLVEQMATANTVTGDFLIEKYLSLANEQLFTSSDGLFSEKGYEAEMKIYDVYEQHRDAFVMDYLIVGPDKDTLSSFLDEEALWIIQPIFDKGYGLINLEGSYYPAVDYYELNEQYGGQVGEMTGDLLGITKDVLVNQTTAEEYLIITPAELMERSIRIEQFFMMYPEAPTTYKDMLKWELNTCIYKLVTPNPFDGTLNEDGTLSVKYQSIYKTILEESRTPVVTEVVQGFKDWLATRENGFVATYEDTQDLYDISGKLYDQSISRLHELYDIEMQY